MIFIDTNILFYLIQEDLQVLSPEIIDLLETEDIVLSPMIQLEFQFLAEKGKLEHKPDFYIFECLKILNAKVDQIDFQFLIDFTINLNWTRDPFDRFITAHALARESRIITSDRNILKNYEKAIW